MLILYTFLSHFFLAVGLLGSEFGFFLSKILAMLSFCAGLNLPHALSVTLGRTSSNEGSSRQLENKSPRIFLTPPNA